MKRTSLALAAICALLSFTACNNQEPAAKDTNAAAATDSMPKVTDNWKLGVQLWTFRMFTMTEALDKVDSAGIKYVEAFWGQPLGGDSKDTFGIKMTQAGRDRLKELLKSRNIQMVAMGVISPGTKEEWVDAFKLAKEFNLQYITAEPKKALWDTVDSLAGFYNIKIAIHDHPAPNAFSHPDSVLAAMKGHPNIGACADIGHWARNGLNIVDCLKKLEGHVYGVHLKDITEFNNTHAADTVVGKGIITFDPVFAELKRQQFAGMLSIEHESNWYHSLPDVVATVKFYDDAVQKLR
ncbi:MAG TPA: sugar phosphate isomerase/epimerase [Chitinophagaceae bacterium]|nr:sugar phosphate isomerase/epimerase [Chitinophagaceae bacterium]